MENKKQRPPSEYRKRNPTRRKRTQDRRRADLGTGKRRKNYGDPRSFLGDRRTKVQRPPGEKPTNYDLKVDPKDDWEKEVRRLKRKKRKA